jgi:hypothetical protein
MIVTLLQRASWPHLNGGKWRQFKVDTPPIVLEGARHFGSFIRCQTDHFNKRVGPDNG